MGYLYRFEVKGIQSFIFSTNQMKEIAGGSAIIDSLFHPKDWNIDNVEQSAAGSATIYFEDKVSLEQFASEFPRYVQYRAPGVELVQAWVSFDKDSVNEKGALTKLLNTIAHNRNQKLVQLPELGPLLLRSGRTGLGVVDRRSINQKNRSVDLASVAKEKAGREQRDSLEQALLESNIYCFSKGEVFERDQEMVAVIHIDGNDIGQRVQKCKTLKQYKDFSTALTQATKTAACQAIKQAIEVIEDKEILVKEKDSGKLELPIRPIVLGGDDFTLVIKAKYAREFVKNYIENFEAYTKEGQHKEKLFGEMHASAGVAFVKAKSPFSGNYKLSEDLCKYAKNVLRERGEGNTTPSSVAFHRVTTTAIPRWSEIRERELSSDYENKRAKDPKDPNFQTFGTLSASPYLLKPKQELEDFFSLDDLDGLVDNAKRLPRGPLRQWVQQIQSDYVRAGQRWERFALVSNDKRDTKEALANCSKIWNKSSSSEEMTFRYRREGNQEQITSEKSWGLVSPVLDCLSLIAVEGKGDKS